MDDTPATPAAPLPQLPKDPKKRRAVTANLKAIAKLKTSPTANMGQTMGEIAFNAVAFYILNITGPKLSAGWIDTTSMATAAETAGTIGNKTGKASMYNDPGEMTVEGLFDPNAWPPAFGKSSAGALTLTVGPLADALSFTATMVEFEPKMPLEGRAMTVDMKFRISGAIT
jgi:hypothetical protein